MVGLHSGGLGDCGAGWRSLGRSSGPGQGRVRQGEARQRGGEGHIDVMDAVVVVGAVEVVGIAGGGGRDGGMGAWYVAPLVDSPLNRLAN